MFLYSLTYRQFNLDFLKTENILKVETTTSVSTMAEQQKAIQINDET